MVTSRKVQVRRVYEGRVPSDGTRVLVDRLWPRGMTKANVDIDEWCKEVAPSTRLRRWYRHDPQRFEEFERRYVAELSEKEQAVAVEHLRALMKRRALTLLTATKLTDISGASILATFLRDPTRNV